MLSMSHLERTSPQWPSAPFTQTSPLLLSLNKGLTQQAKLYTKLDKLSKRLEATEDEKAQGEIDEKMSVIRTSLEKV